MASVLDVAAYILKAKGSMSTMKLQKLCYYSQGWALAWDEVPLFPERIQAWANGPVVYELFDAHRGRFQIDSLGDGVGDPDALTQDERDTVDAVLEGYAHLTGQELSDKTHSERPWLEARVGTPAGGRSAKSLSLEVMQDFFGGLAAAEATV